MAEGRNRRLWDHTATVAAAALSAFRERMIDPAKLHPYERGGKRSKGIPLTAGNIGLLRTVFLPAAGKQAGVDGPARKAGRSDKEKRPWDGSHG